MRTKIGVFLFLSVLTACSRSEESKRDRFLAEGHKFFEAKDYNRALIAFKNAAQIAPKDAEAQYRLGLTFAAIGDVRDAVSSLRRATELSPAHTPAQLKLAQILADSGDSDLIQDARKQMIGVLARSPDNLDAMMTLAYLDTRLGQSDEAERQLRQALSRFPRNLMPSVALADLLLARKDLKGAEEILKAAADQAPDSSDAAVALGNFYLVTGRLPAAEEQARRALKIDPKNGPALVILANMQIKSGKAEEAERTYAEISSLSSPVYKPLHAEYLLRNGKAAEAISELEKLAKDNPGNAVFRQRLVFAYVSAGEARQAEQFLTEALQKDPKDLELRYRRSELYLTMGRNTEAQNDINEVLHAAPRSGTAHYLLARVHHAQGAAANRKRELELAIRYDPDLLQARIDLAQVLIESRAPKAALELLNEAPKSQYRTMGFLLQRNWAFWAMHDWMALSHGIDEAAAVGTPPELLLQSGLLKLEQQDATGAQKSLEQALTQSPDDLRILQALARCYIAEKRLADGTRKFQEYAAQRPKSPWAQQALGEWLVLTGSPTEARNAFVAAKAADPNFSPADLTLAQIDTSEGRLDSAREKLLRVVAANDQDVTAHLSLGVLEVKAGRPAAALEHYKKVVQLQPTNADALNDLAYLLLNANQVDEALTYAQRAQELAPDNGAIRDTVGWALYRKGMYTAALQHLQKAASDGKNAVRQYHLSMAYVKVGDLERAQEYLTNGLKTDPNLPEAAMARQTIADMLKPSQVARQ